MAAVDANTTNPFTVGKGVLIELITLHITKGVSSVPILDSQTIDFHSLSVPEIVLSLMALLALLVVPCQATSCTMVSWQSILFTRPKMHSLASE